VKKLFYKIFFSYLVIICVSFLLVDVFVSGKVKDILTDQVEKELLSYARFIDQISLEKASRHLNQIANTSSARITLINSRGEVFADSEKKRRRWTII